MISRIKSCSSTKVSAWSLVTLLLLALGGCTFTKEPSLYERLGEKAGIERVVNNLIIGIAQEDKIRHYFIDVDIPLFRENLIIHLCQVANGPCYYEGLSMEEAHKGLNINDADFNTVVSLLRSAMNKEGIAYTDQNDLLSRLAPMHKDITYH